MYMQTENWDAKSISNNDKKKNGKRETERKKGENWLTHADVRPKLKNENEQNTTYGNANKKRMPNAKENEKKHETNSNDTHKWNWNETAKRMQNFNRM